MGIKTNIVKKGVTDGLQSSNYVPCSFTEGEFTVSEAKDGFLIFIPSGNDTKTIKVTHMNDVEHTITISESSEHFLRTAIRFKKITEDGTTATNLEIYY